MLERLTGRLKWERTEEGTRIQLPQHIRLGYLAAIVFAALLPLQIDDLVPKPPIHGSGLGPIPILISSFIVALLLVLHLATTSSIILTPTEASKAVFLFGKQLRKRSRQNNSLYGLRSNLMVSEWSGKDIENRNTVVINQGFLDFTLASKLTKTEAEALIAKMMEIYPFPANEREESVASNGSVPKSSA